MENGFNSLSRAETLEIMQMSTAVLVPLMIVSIALSVVMIIAEWKIFVKAGYAGWKCLIPIYNVWCLFEMVYGNGAKMFLLLIPIANIVFLILFMIDMSDAFGQEEVAFKIGMVLLSAVFMCIIGFHPAITYVGSKADRAA